MKRFICWLALVGSLASCHAVFADQSDQAEGIAFFEKKIRPVLVQECSQCHSSEKGKKISGGLNLDTRDGLRKGGDSGPAIVPGNPAASLIVKAIGYKDDALKMPPKKHLNEEIVRDFEEWIRGGAADPRDGTPVDRKSLELEQARSHWAFQSVQTTLPPTPQKREWPNGAMDAFVLSRLETKDLTPVDVAERSTLLRRVTFDLIGLPPTPDEVESFSNDTSIDSFARVVDRLLASPQFGEKWARHWLDVARYAESTGKTVNFNYPHAWRYRDYVIAAFNNDKPYNEFIKEQLAGDLMKSTDAKQKAERIIATAFLAIGPKTLNERNGLKFELDIVDEQIDVTMQAFQGLTAACARCHDHKIEPISQNDYYALAGIFRSTETCYGTVRFINAQRPGQLLPLPADAEPTVGVPHQSETERRRLENQIRGLQTNIRNMKDQLQQFFANGQVSLLQAKLDAYDADGTPKILAMGVRDRPIGAERFPRRNMFAAPGGFTYNGSRSIDDSPIFVRGEPEQPGEAKIPRGTLTVLTKTPLTIGSQSSGRLELAEWIASEANPLTARVLVNRVWLQLFGQGLVPTADDFGLGGRPPSHPELLDHLARRFVQSGWSMKSLIKEIVMSRTYQLSSTSQSRSLEMDPENVLLWRMKPRRLDAESLRDSLLAVSGQLDLTPPLGSLVANAGEGPVAPPRLGGDQLNASVNDPRNVHRSIYLPIVRDNLPEALSLFDAADPTLIVSDRQITTVPSQGLYLLNNAFVMRMADAAADRILSESNAESDRIQRAFQQVFGRAATESEHASASRFLASYRDKLNRVPDSKVDREIWSAFCQALFASAEFQYRK